MALLTGQEQADSSISSRSLWVIAIGLTTLLTVACVATVAPDLFAAEASSGEALTPDQKNERIEFGQKNNVW